MGNKFLVHSVNGKVVSRTLCTSHQHANNIWANLLERHDPFTRNGIPIAAVTDTAFSYQRRPSSKS